MFEKAKDFVGFCGKCCLHLAAFLYISDQFHSLECDDAAQRNRISENETSIENLEKRLFNLRKA